MGSYVEHANMSVTDVDEAIRFFTTAMPGFRVRHDSGPGPERWVHLGTDATYMSINLVSDPTEEQFRRHHHPGCSPLGFAVEDADALRERMLAAGYGGNKELKQLPAAKGKLHAQHSQFALLEICNIEASEDTVAATQRKSQHVSWRSWDRRGGEHDERTRRTSMKGHGSNPCISE